MSATFSVGDRVMVRNRGRARLSVAILVDYAPYRWGTTVEGWMVSYPDTTESWHCHGGWIPTSQIECHEETALAVGALLRWAVQHG